MLSFEKLSKLEENDYKKYILDFFLKINDLRKEGLKYNDELRIFLTNKYTEILNSFKDYNKSLYRERLEILFFELDNLNIPPRFGIHPLIYIKSKWNIHNVSE